MHYQVQIFSIGIMSHWFSLLHACISLSSVSCKFCEADGSARNGTDHEFLVQVLSQAESFLQVPRVNVHALSGNWNWLPNTFWGKVHVQCNPDLSKPQIFLNSWFFEPKVICLGFTLVQHCNFTPTVSNHWFFKTPNTSIELILGFLS